MSWLRSAASAWGGVVADVAKAMRTEAPATRRSIAPAHGLVEDPLASHAASAGYKMRPSYLTYDLIERMAHQTTIPRVIIGTRINQAALFATPVDDDFSIGFRVVPITSGGKSPTRAALAKADEIKRFIRLCGDPGRKDAALIGTNFDSFTRQVIRDSLIYDQMNWQIRPRGNGQPYEMIPMAAKSLRVKSRPERAPLEWMSGEVTIPEESADDPAYVQLFQEAVVAEFSPRELVWGVRNPCTNLDSNGYGWSEMEDGVHLCTAWLNAYTYNTRFFGSGAAASGILSFEGPNPMPPAALEEFKDQWYQLVTGVENAWRTPVLSLAGGTKLNWTDLAKSNREMQFREWMELQVRLFCSLFLIDPAEIGFPMGDASGGGAVFANRRENRIKTGKDKGLRPLLALYADKLNTHVVQQIDPEFELRFVGLESEDEDTRLERAEKAAGSLMTVDEGRATLGLGPMANGAGKIILSQVWVTAQQQAGQGADGMPVDPDDPDGNPGEDGGGEQDEPDDDEPDDDEPDSPREQAKSLRAALLATTNWTDADEAAYAAAVRRGATAGPTAWDVSIGAAAAGYDARGGVDWEDAERYGLVRREVGTVRVFAKSERGAEAVAAYLEAGGQASEPGMLAVCGAAEQDVVALADLRRLERRRMAATMVGGRR